MPKISILGTSTPPPYCDCEMDEPVAHHHWAVFVDPTGPRKRTLLSSLFCLSNEAYDDFTSAAVFDLYGKRLRKRQAIQVSLAAIELPVQIVVAKPGAPPSKAWTKGDKVVDLVEKALKPVPSQHTTQDGWIDAVIIALIEADLLERFNQDAFTKFARAQVGPASLPGDQKEPDVVKELDYVEERKKG